MTLTRTSPAFGGAICKYVIEYVMKGAEIFSSYPTEILRMVLKSYDHDLFFCVFIFILFHFPDDDAYGIGTFDDFGMLRRC